MKNENNEVVMVSGCRTAVGNFGGSLKDVMKGHLAGPDLCRPAGSRNTSGEPSNIKMALAQKAH